MSQIVHMSQMKCFNFRRIFMVIVLKPALIQHRIPKSISYKRYAYAQNIPSLILIKFKVISFSDIQTKIHKI